MKRIFVLSSLLFLTASSAHAQSLQARRIDAVKQWENVIRRAKTSQGMYAAANLLSDVAYKVDQTTDPSRDWPYRTALHYLEKTAYNKAQFLSNVERGLYKSSFQKQVWYQGLEIRLLTAERIVRQGGNGQTPVRRWQVAPSNITGDNSPIDNSFAGQMRRQMRGGRF